MVRRFQHASLTSPAARMSESRNPSGSSPAAGPLVVKQNPMSSSMGNPTFSGALGENVEWFILRVKMMWRDVQMDTPEELEMAKVMTMAEGLTGSAKDYYRSLPLDIRDDFAALTKALRTRFPHKAHEEDREEILVRVMSLGQGQQTFEQYADEARKLAGVLAEQDMVILARRWAMGLHQDIRHIVLSKVNRWVNKSKEMEVDEVIEFAKTCLTTKKAR